ncbi:MAG: hypothetical protein J5637_05535 [Prevotella sp.]|nr:hypothetical protein [Prevotella sp.]
MRLSLYSQLIKNGEDHQLVYDNGADNGRIFDVRTGGTLSLPVDFNGIIRMVALRQNGCMVYVIKPIFSRVGDYRALAVFVPRKALLAAVADLPTIIDAAAQVLAEGGDTAVLSGWFSRNYEEHDFEWSAPKNYNGYAYRLYGKGTRYSAADLLGQALLQPEYAGYEGVFLIDAAYGTLVRSEKMTDLTNHVLSMPAVVSPPKKRLLANNGQIYLKGADKPFDKPVLGRVGDRLPLELRKDHCVPFHFDYLVQKSRCEAALPADILWRHIISGVTVQLVDEEGEPIVNGSKSVQVKGAEMVRVSGKEYRVLPEKDLTQALLMVKCDGYQDKEEEVDLSGSQQVTVVMKKALARMNYSVNGTSKGSRVKFELDWPELDAEQSPLPGYKVNSVRGRQVTLEREKATSQKKGKTDMLADTSKTGKKSKDAQPMKISKKFFYGLGFGVLMGIALGGYSGAFLKENAINKRLAEEAKQRELLEQQRADSLRHAQIVDYLDKAAKWTKTEADSLFDGALAGLYDAMNEYDFDAFTAKTDSLRLSDSQLWATLKESVERAKKPDVLTTLKTTRSPYSKDGSITIEKYIQVLDQTAGYIPDKNATQAASPDQPAAQQ